MKKQAIPIIVIVAVIVGAVGWYAYAGVKPGVPDSSQPVNSIVITEDGFQPESMTVPAGTTVTFINRDIYWHWPASDPHPSHTFYSEIDPKEPVKPQGTWEVTLTKPGTWGLHDHLAPYILGSITVTQ